MRLKTLSHVLHSETLAQFYILSVLNHWAPTLPSAFGFGFGFLILFIFSPLGFWCNNLGTSQSIARGEEAMILVHNPSQKWTWEQCTVVLLDKIRQRKRFHLLCKTWGLNVLWQLGGKIDRTIPKCTFLLPKNKKLKHPSSYIDSRNKYSWQCPSATYRGHQLNCRSFCKDVISF